MADFIRWQIGSCLICHSIRIYQKDKGSSDRSTHDVMASELTTGTNMLVVHDQATATGLSRSDENSVRSADDLFRDEIVRDSDGMFAFRVPDQRLANISTCQNQIRKKGKNYAYLASSSDDSD
jgi:hypothetical protein